MPNSVPIAAFVFGAILIMIAMFGGGFTLFGASVPRTVNKAWRSFALVLGSTLIIVGLLNPFERFIAQAPTTPPNTSKADSITSIPDTSESQRPTIALIDTATIIQPTANVASISPLIPPSPIVPPTTIPPTDTPLPPTAIPFPDQQLTSILDATGGTFGIAIYDITHDKLIYTRNQNQVFPAASLTKLPIVLTAYHLAQQGQFDLNQEITLRSEDVVGGTGSLQNESVDSRYSYRELCRRMIVDSDNTAGNIVLNRIGYDAVNNYMSQLGTQQTKVQRLFMDFAARDAGRDNLTTPADMLLILQIIAQGDTQEILNFMQHNKDRVKLPAQLPLNAVVANKTGTLPGIEHDVGLINIPERTYIIIVMSQDLPDNQNGISAIAQFSQDVYKWFTQ
jgi:beta-lactamase class A